MEWGRAKKFVVILLVVLNVCLAGLNYQQKRASAMTASQEKAIFEVLSQNGITMYTDLITNTQEMSRLSVTVPTYTKETIENLFFAGEKTTIIPGKTSVIYRGLNQELTMEGTGGKLVFQDVLPQKGDLTKADALREAEAFMAGIKTAFPDFKEFDMKETDAGYCVEYYQNYKGNFVFSNWFRIFVSQTGVYQVDFSYCNIEGYSGEKKDIFYGDEALLTFMRALDHEKTEGEITVNRMELGYDSIEQVDAVGRGTMDLVPCYRIYTMEQEEPCIINAYTCQVVSSGS